MGGVCNPVKDQVLLHALSNVLSVPYEPIFKGIMAVNVSNKMQHVCLKYGISKPTTSDNGTCSFNLRDTIGILVSRGEVSESDLENEVAILLKTVYSDPAYINAMGPFL